MNLSITGVKIMMFLHRSWTISVVMGMVLPGAIGITPALAGDLGNGRVVFDHSPRLVRSAASFSGVDTPSTYEFTIQVPDGAGAPLHALKIAQEPGPPPVRFDLTQNRAFEGTRFAGGPPVGLAAMGGLMPPGHPNEVILVFDPPVAPGKTITVALDVPRNPMDGNVYLFGVTAYPTGEQSPGLFLGYGRIHIYGNSH
jgi:hypothetical protein